MKSSARTTVFVGLSGGVDSSVAALLLKRAGYRVVGVFIKVWQPDFLVCNWEAERLDAMRVAATLSIPFLTCDATERYKADVVDYLVREYNSGRTPNPDVMCNKHVKFGAFIDFADAHGADLVATGHYARKIDWQQESLLARGVDDAKDQSYFLWTLTRDQLTRSLFPLGEMMKEEVRQVAARARLPTARKPDSQGVCFLGALDMRAFLQHFIEKTPGDVYDVEGRIVGTHEGARFYTIGQRHGFSSAAQGTQTSPRYIIEKDLRRNRLVVSSQKPEAASSSTREIPLVETEWRGKDPHGTFTVQTRYRQVAYPAAVHTTGARSAVVSPRALHELPAPGQSCVVYEGEICRGGGIISA